MVQTWASFSGMTNIKSCAKLSVVVTVAVSFVYGFLWMGALPLVFLAVCFVAGMVDGFRGLGESKPAPRVERRPVRGLQPVRPHLPVKRENAAESDSGPVSGAVEGDAPADDSVSSEADSAAHVDVNSSVDDGVDVSLDDERVSLTQAELDALIADVLEREFAKVFEQGVRIGANAERATALV